MKRREKIGFAMVVILIFVIILAVTSCFFRPSYIVLLSIVSFGMLLVVALMVIQGIKNLSRSLKSKDYSNIAHAFGKACLYFIVLILTTYIIPYWIAGIPILQNTINFVLWLLGLHILFLLELANRK